MEISQHPWTRLLVRRLPLPVALPHALRRPDGPWDPHPFAGMRAVIDTRSGSQSALADAWLSIFARGGGTASPKDVAGQLPALAAAKDADALIVDATQVRHPADLAGVYEFLQPRLERLAANGRVLIFAEQAPEGAAEALACLAALRGLVKSLAKELGRHGSTAQLIILHPQQGADWSWEDALSGPLSYLLTPRSAFVTGQSLHIGSHPTSKPNTWRWPEVRPLANKKILVTGAAQGIGKAIAQKLASEGAQVIGVDHPREKQALDETMAGLATRGLAWTVDLAHSDAAEQLASSIREQLQCIDGLINNAGITRDRLLKRMSRTDWDLTIDINLKASMELIRKLTGLGSELPLLASPGGRIVNIASINGIAGAAGQTNYAASKAGLAAYSTALAPKLAPYGITINALAPGFIDTRMTQAMPFALREVGRRFNTLAQGGLVGDVAEAAAFFVSPGSYAVSGEVLRVCGQNFVGA